MCSCDIHTRILSSRPAIGVGHIFAFFAATPRIWRTSTSYPGPPFSADSPTVSNMLPCFIRQVVTSTLLGGPQILLDRPPSRLPFGYTVEPSADTLLWYSVTTSIRTLARAHIRQRASGVRSEFGFMPHHEPWKHIYVQLVWTTAAGLPSRCYPIPVSLRKLRTSYRFGSYCFSFGIRSASAAEAEQLSPYTNKSQVFAILPNLIVKLEFRSGIHSSERRNDLMTSKLWPGNGVCWRRAVACTQSISWVIWCSFQGTQAYKSLTTVRRLDLWPRIQAVSPRDRVARQSHTPKLADDRILHRWVPFKRFVWSTSDGYVESYMRCPL